jgi:hypothetical protein
VLNRCTDTGKRTTVEITVKAARYLLNRWMDTRRNETSLLLELNFGLSKGAELIINKLLNVQCVCGELFSEYFYLCGRLTSKVQLLLGQLLRRKTQTNMAVASHGIDHQVHHERSYLLAPGRGALSSSRRHVLWTRRAP